MRFSTVITLGLTLVATASACIVGAMPVNNLQDLTTREASLDISESLYTRDVSELVARAKASLKIPKKLESGSVSQQEEPEVTDLGEEAMKDHGVKKGTLVCGWHIRGSRDKREHFTIEPSDGSKRIHVYKDGSSTQGIPKEC